MKVEYYRCYSINLVRWLSANQARPVGKQIDKRNGKTYWIYVVDADLSVALTAYSEMKQASLNKD